MQKERFRYFIKVPELAAFYSEITDFRTAKEVMGGRLVVGSVPRYKDETQPKGIRL